MRILRKYKNLSFLKLSSYKLRLLKFKRTKWKKALVFYKFLSLQNCLFNHKTVLIKYNSWERLALQYKNFMLLKNTYKNRFDGLNLINFNLHVLNGKQKNIYKMDYIVEVLMFNLGFCSSIYEAQNLIKNKKIFLNNHVFCTLKKTLKRGDIVEIKHPLVYTDFYKTFSIYYNIVEVDLYNQTFIIVKDFEDLKYSDLSLMFFENYSKLV